MDWDFWKEMSIIFGCFIGMAVLVFLGILAMAYVSDRYDLNEFHSILLGFPFIVGPIAGVVACIAKLTT